MIDDAANVADGSVVDADVCIVGGGAAGITLARELRDTRLRVVLLESGGLEQEPATQALCEGQNVGHSYYSLLGSRLRFLGGTTNHWGGLTVPLAPISFETREWVPDSGWPFLLEDFVPYYQRAHEVCQIGPYDYREEYWAPRRGKPLLPLRTEHIVPSITQFSPPTRFGVTYRADLEEARNLTVLLHANALRFEANEAASAVQRVRAGTLDGRRFDVTARTYVLAAGAIENARLLLLSDDVAPRGLGNDHDLVGRYFMEHLSLGPGTFVPTDFNAIAPFFEQDRVDGFGANGYLAFSDEWQREQRTLNVSLHFYSTFESAGLQSAKVLRDALREGKLPADVAYHLWAVLMDLDEIVGIAWDRFTGEEDWRRRSDRTTLMISQQVEQAPNRDSRVRLSSERDALGQERVELDWQLSPDIEGYTIRKSLRTFAATVARLGLGRIQTNVGEEGDDWVENVVGQ